MAFSCKPPEHYALCVYGVNHKKYAGEAIDSNASCTDLPHHSSTGAAKAVGLVFQDALLFPRDEQNVANPSANALPAAALLASFIGTGSSFLAFAALAEKRGLTDTALPGKSFYFLGGLTEATETITVFAAMFVWPGHFAVLAYGFAALCAITTGMGGWWGCWRLG